MKAIKFLLKILEKTLFVEYGTNNNVTNFLTVNGKLNISVLHKLKFNVQCKNTVKLNANCATS